ncbi:Thermophilic serine proteinase precursor [compost metagenome]
MKRLIGRASKAALAGLMFTGLNAFAAAPEAVPGEYIVKLKNSVSAKSNINVLSQQLGSYIKDTIPGQNIVVIKRPVFEIQSNVVKSLSQNDLVDIVEPNYIYSINKTPNDPMLGQLWGMKNDGQKDSENRAGVVGVDIGAEQAWDITTGSQDVVVAVIDTGLNYNHPDLKDNAWVNEAEAKGKPGVDDDGNGIIDDIHGAAFIKTTPSGDPMDDHGHGSHCSGTIGARGDDGKGIVGVAWNVRIMGVKFLDRNGSGSLDNALKAIDYATKMGAKVMSNSWGGGGYSETLKQAIERSNTAGALFVAAAGNESNNNDSNPSYPASYQVPNVLSVAAINNRGEIASFSNYGRSSVHVGAPGVNIVSSITGAAYDSWSGTSMATPHVSGMAVLLASAEPTLTGIQMKERIVATAKPITGLRGQVKSGGLANAYTMLTNTIPQPDPNDPVNWTKTPVSVSSTHPYADNAKEEYEVRVPGAKQISLYFERFETEREYDKVELYDSKGNKVQTLSGRNDDTYSSVIDGDYVRIVFTSDNSINKYGFDITQAAWR